jgi:hypothetical protein
MAPKLASVAFNVRRLKHRRKFEVQDIYQQARVLERSVEKVPSGWGQTWGSSLRITRMEEFARRDASQFQNSR